MAAESYSIIPYAYNIGIDVRLTISFDETSVKKLLEAVVAQIDQGRRRPCRQLSGFTKAGRPAGSMKEHTFELR
jgi:hypothetical protein